MLSVHSDLTTPTMQKQKNRLNRNGPSWLEAVHGGRLYDSNPIATNYFSEALGGLVVFVNPKVDFWGPLINEADCLKSSGSLSGQKRCNMVPTVQTLCEEHRHHPVYAVEALKWKKQAHPNRTSSRKHPLANEWAVVW